MAKQGSKIKKQRAQPARARPARPARMEQESQIQWTHQTQLVAIVVRPQDNAKLALSVSQIFGVGGRWTVAAVETHAKSFEGFFDDHGHKVLGEYDFKEAVLAVESYAKAWLKGHKVAKIEQCTCEEIPDPDELSAEAREMLHQGIADVRTGRVEPLDVIDAEFEDEPTAICPECKHDSFHHKAPDLLGCIGSAECRCARTAASIYVSPTSTHSVPSN